MKSFKEATVKVPMGKFKDLAKTIAVGTIEKSPNYKVFKFLTAMGKKVRLERDPNSRTGSRVVIEKAVSKSQQRFMGMVRAVQKGDMKAPSPEVAKAAKTMKKKDAKDFASTKHKGLPEMKTFKQFQEGVSSAVKTAKKMGGNMTGAVKKIEKQKKGLSQNPRVQKALQKANEGAMSKDKEKHDTGGFRISNAAAKAARDRIAKKHGLKK